MLTPLQMAERKKAIGGSDVPHLVGLPPFGCTRRLWYDKKGVPEDFPQTKNRHMRRGDALEEFAVREYYEATSRGVRTGIPWRLDPDTPFFGVHADGLQEMVECGPESLLEVKCPSARWFYAVKNKPEPPAGALLQAQWGMMVHRLRAGTVLLFSADAWLIRFWDVGNDDHMQSDLRAMGVKFWQSLRREEPPYGRLDPHDPRCSGCPWRKKCQGLGRDADPVDLEMVAARGSLPRVEVDPLEADAAMREFLDAKAATADAAAMLEIARAKVMGLFPGEDGLIETGFARAKLKKVFRGEYTSVVKATTYPLLHVKQMAEDVCASDDEVETY